MKDSRTSPTVAVFAVARSVQGAAACAAQDREVEAALFEKAFAACHSEGGDAAVRGVVLASE